ncbi:Fur family transcriptional regulator [Ignavigranum ruoffiae]|uniref:Fur family transcriptional regulator n=1 Tax=Ignavigranum ruoffiae TaxID=89093 RepID=UPI003AFF8663
MHQHSLHDAVKYLKERKIRITPQRQAIIEYLIDTQDHPTVDEIYQAIKQRYGNMSLATIYNNLNVLVKAGLVDEMKFNGVTSRYDYNHHQHYHIICVECGKIADVNYADVAPIAEAAEQQTGYQVFHSNIELHGLCPDCQAKLQKGAAEK